MARMSRFQKIRASRSVLPRIATSTMARPKLSAGITWLGNSASWRGVVPKSFRRFRELQPEAELQLQPSASLEQLEALRSGRLDAGFVNFIRKSDPE